MARLGLLSLLLGGLFLAACLAQPAPVVCESSACGEHGTCLTAEDAACTCEVEYVGATCSECADGYQDNDGDGTCEPSCETADTACGSLAVCDDSSGKAQCVCPPGSTSDETMDGCHWTGVVQDPDFQEVGGWEATHGAYVDPPAPGGVESGEGVITEDAMCNDGTLSQTFVVPELESGWTLGWFVDTVENGGSDGALGMFVNGVLVRTLTGGHDAFCFGDMYGGEVTVTFAPLGRPAACGTGDPLRTFGIDHVELSPVEAATCPESGVVLNGDFDMGAEGWETEGGAAIVEGGGENGSWGATFYSSGSSCNWPAITGTYSVPALSQGAGLALNFDTVGDAGGWGWLAVWLDGMPLGMALDPGGSTQPEHLCLPDWARGAVHELKIGTPDQCPMNPELAIDRLQTVPLDTCADRPSIADGGFESMWQPSTAWVRHNAEASNEDKHSGERALQMTFRDCSSSAEASTTFVVPGAAATGGPAVKLWQRTAVDNGITVTARVGSAARTLTPSSSWTPEVLCLDPSWSGLPMVFEIRMTVCDPGVSCHCPDPSYAPAEEWIDDVEATTDPSCPR